MASWTKLRNGDWGVKVEGTAQAGQTVSVRKKSGEQQSVTVDKVIWSGNGITLCSVKQRERSEGRSDRHVCAECGRPGYLVSDLEDGLMKHPKCCDIEP